MANQHIEKIIEDIKRLNGGKEDDLVLSIRAKAGVYDDDMTEEEAREILKECIAEQMSKLSSSIDEITADDDEIVVDEVYMANAIETVKGFLDRNDWHYSSESRRQDLHIFSLGFTVRGVNLRVKICVEDDPKVCRVEAVLPITADATYEYPLCKLLAKESYQKRFGAFKYDERDGEITYEYSFRTGNAFYEDDLDTYFHAVITTAASSYDAIRKCCVGRFKNSEVKEILEKVNKLVDDISE